MNLKTTLDFEAELEFKLTLEELKDYVKYLSDSTAYKKEYENILSILGAAESENNGSINFNGRESSLLYKLIKSYAESLESEGIRFLDSALPENFILTSSICDPDSEEEVEVEFNKNT